MTVVSFMYMPIEVPNSSKLQRIPVKSPFLDGRANQNEKLVKQRKYKELKLLTFKEGLVLVCIDVDLLELANLNLFRESEL